MPAINRRNLVRALIAAALFAAGISILSLVIAGSENAGNKDFISYWAAGQLLIRHSNPYDAAAVFQLEKSAGFHESTPLIMRNPPFALVLALPLGLVSAKLGAVLWSVLLVAAIMASVRLLWSIHGRPLDRLHLFGYIFAPTVACLPLGQTSVFALLGVVLFLHFHQTRPFAAGACLALVAIKPHLFLAFGLVLLLWVFYRRVYSVLLGPVAVIVCALIPLMYFDPSVFSHYLPVLTQASAESRVIPSLSAVVRVAINPGAAWPQFVPVICGCLWAARYFSRHASEWNWNTHGSNLLLVSVWVAPYTWFTDEVVVLPAILQGIYTSARRGRSLISFGIIDGIAL
ncbi:MAG TPA: glycosyltransferase family 87 protein, partial [Candidatus Angelobacter sp.]|nr:glycosyltransferase family 87 protein [Candidatus Angelobacter sp.]